jgi:hypothetical protein
MVSFKLVIVSAQKNNFEINEFEIHLYSWNGISVGKEGPQDLHRLRIELLKRSSYNSHEEHSRLARAIEKHTKHHNNAISMTCFWI